jgi:hypothetical protein
MPQLISDDGQVAVVETDAGAQVRVPSSYAVNLGLGPITSRPDPALDIPMPPPASNEIDGTAVQAAGGLMDPFSPSGAQASQSPAPVSRQQQAVPPTPAPVQPAPADVPAPTESLPPRTLAEAQQRQADAAEGRKQAVVGEAAAAIQANDAQVAQMEANQRETAAFDAVTEERRQRAETEREESRQKWQESINAFKDAKVDPDHYMKTRSAGQLFIAALGTMLSGVGAGLTGKDNLALAMLNKSIDSDIDAQKTEMQKLGQAEGMNRSYYEANAKSLQDDESARLMTRGQMLQGAIEKLKLMAARSNNATIQAQAASQITSLESELAANQASFQERQQAFRAQQEIARGQLGIQYGHLKLARDEAARRKAQEAAVGPYDRQLMVLDDRGEPLLNDNGTPMQARNDKEAASVSTMAVTYREWRSKLERYKNLATQSQYTGPLAGDRAKQALQLREELIVEWKNGAGLGALSGADRDMAEIAIPAPNSWTNTDPTGRIDQLLDLADSKIDRFMGSAGYRGSYSRNYSSPISSFKPGSAGANIDRQAPRGLPAADGSPYRPPEEVGPPRSMAPPGPPPDRSRFIHGAAGSEPPPVDDLGPLIRRKR